MVKQLNLRIGYISLLFSPRGCKHCLTAWWLVTPHILQLRHWRLETPLCTTCWQELGAAHRLGYTWQLWQHQYPYDSVSWKQVRDRIVHA